MLLESSVCINASHLFCKKNIYLVLPTESREEEVAFICLTILAALTAIAILHKTILYMHVYSVRITHLRCMYL